MSLGINLLQISMFNCNTIMQSKCKFLNRLIATLTYHQYINSSKRGFRVMVFNATFNNIQLYRGGGNWRKVQRWSYNKGVLYFIFSSRKKSQDSFTFVSNNSC